MSDCAASLRARSPRGAVVDECVCICLSVCLSRDQAWGEGGSMGCRGGMGMFPIHCVSVVEQKYCRVANTDVVRTCQAGDTAPTPAALHRRGGDGGRRRESRAQDGAAGWGPGRRHAVSRGLGDDDGGGAPLGRTRGTRVEEGEETVEGGWLCVVERGWRTGDSRIRVPHELCPLLVQYPVVGHLCPLDDTRGRGLGWTMPIFLHGGGYWVCACGRCCCVPALDDIEPHVWQPNPLSRQDSGFGSRGES